MVILHGYIWLQLISHLQLNNIAFGILQVNRITISICTVSSIYLSKGRVSLFFQVDSYSFGIVGFHVNSKMIESPIMYIECRDWLIISQARPTGVNVSSDWRIVRLKIYKRGTDF